MEKNNQPEEDNCLNETLLKCIEDQENGSKNNEDDEVDSSKDSDVDFYDEGNELEIEGDDETEGELGDNENLDVENSEGPAIRKVKNDIQNVNGKKQKRRKRDMTKRRKIRKIYDESQLEQETLSAQLEEKERLRRLELQKSLATEITPDVCKEVTNSVFVENANHDTLQAQSPVAIDFRQKGKQKLHVIVIDSDDDSEDISFGNQNEEEIEIISSDSVCSSSENDTDDSTDIDENNVGMHSDDRYNVPNPDAKVEVNINHPLYEDDIYLAPQIAKCVKPHQIGGIRFLYDNLVETLARYKVSSGFGCILAHSMGLGKTLQVIAFTDIFLRHTPAKKVLCVVPINTIQNWITEFNTWLPPHPENIEQENKTSESEKEPNGIRYRNFEVYQLGDNNKTTLSRARLVGEWNQNGGVLLMGYELYRVLAMSTPCMASNKCAPAKKRKSNNSSCVTANLEPEVIDLEEEEKNMDLLIAIQNALCNPGPDLVVCDEGHRIKNNQANISQALKRIRTKRRVVLTGYPLQNNLIEYWCMVDFVRPNFLGTRHEFSNMFERPILNGQCSDSTPSDVKLMRYRAHVLHNLLEGFVQRRSQSVLMKCLPLKEEHIILVKLSQIQSQLYDSYINFLLDSVGHLNPIKGFHTCTKIWNHPDVFFSSLEPKKSGLRNESPLTLLDNDTENSTSQDIEESVDPVLNLSALPVQVLQQHPNSTIKSSAAASLAWAKDIMKDYQPFIAEQGGKMAILFEIIEESLSLGEKVLVFSQSLSTLCVIEDFLSRRDIPPFPGRNTENDPTKWAKNKSYFRLDGSTPSQERDRLITAFNSPDNTEVLLFMLSTRAGCLGVNLVGASRVVVFDASWNPCHDVQAVCRVYRYGQKKSSHIYRLISTGTMEKKIYDRQVSKQGVANRVVDELNPEANFTKQEIMSLICDKEPDIQAENVASAANEFSDPVLKRICKNNSNWLSKIPFKHESLLVDKKELKLTKKEKQEARKGYEREKTMSQQGGRYNYNHPESKRKSSTTPIPSNIVRPVPTDRSVQANQLGVMTNIAQRMQSQAFPLCMEPSFRLATYFRNISTKSNQLGPMMPNLRTANLQMQINNPMVMSTNVSNPIESQIIYPSQRCMQSGVGFASTILPCSSMNLTNGSAGSTMSYPAHLSIRVPKVSSTQTWPQTNEIVKIDLDDVPSPVSSPVELDEAQNHGTINPQNGQRLFEIQDTQSTLNPDYNSGKNPDISMTGVVVVDSQQRNISMESTSKSDLPKQVINSLSAVSRTATEDIMNVETPGLLIAVTKDAPSNDVKHISISTLATERRSPLEPPPIVVLQNSLSERGGVGSSDGPSTESLSEDVSARTSQM